MTPPGWMLQRRALLLALALPAPPAAFATLPARVQCIAPAKPGGGFDLTCQFLRDLLRLAPERPIDVEVKYLPGGIGALAFDRAVRQHWSDPATFVAFSTGSLVNLAQGRFGPHHLRDVRWLATLGTEYGAVVVRKESRITSLRVLRELLAGNPAAAVFGASGALGSQDWIKAALLVRAAGSDHRAMRFVSFEGGGQALAALRGGHVDVFCGDMLEAAHAPGSAELKVIGVLAPGRLPGPLSGVPTAREQGLDVVWPTVRGLYMGPGVPDKAFADWSRLLGQLLQRPDAARLLARYGLQPSARIGAELDSDLEQQLRELTTLAHGLHLRVR